MTSRLFPAPLLRESVFTPLKSAYLKLVTVDVDDDDDGGGL